MMRQLMTILLALCLLTGISVFPASAADEETGQWQSVEDFEQYALAFWVRPIHEEIQPATANTGRAFGDWRSGRQHAAVDFLLPISLGSGNGTPIYAMAGGTVISYKPNFYGATDAVAIQHTDGSILRYCEISADLEVGDTVEQGEQIGEMTFGYGNCMLHLELFLGTSEGSLGDPSKSPDGSSGEYYKYVTGSFSRRSDLLDPTFLLDITREMEMHEHDWDETGLCSVCACYKEPIDANVPVQTGAYLVKGRAARLRAYPYAVCDADATLASGEKLTVTGAVENALGEIWYRCRYDGQIVYIEQAKLEKTEDPPFTDVPSDAFYYGAVVWALDVGVASGAEDAKFFPEDGCTRAQAVTFLWRAAGSPEPEGTLSPFEDVSPGNYYYDAVLWAVENGVTSGVSSITFEPDAKVTRAQAVTFLWRSSGWPEPKGTVNPFDDIASDSFYDDAVLWAVENGITSGTSAITFSPDDPCTRGQIVTFLYRCV